MRVVFCHLGVSGYMAACWRALAARRGVELLVIAHSNVSHESSPFADKVVEGVPCRLLADREQDDSWLLKSLVIGHRPQVVFVAGWGARPFRDLAKCPELSGARFIMGMDTPRRGDVRQRMARLLLRPYLKRMDRVIVPGERSWQYARELGIHEDRIRRGFYGINYDAFSADYGQRQSRPHGWPRRFLYTGRYTDEKGIDVLLDAYRQYRKTVSDPWPLTCCGQGKWAKAIAGTEGVLDRGFLQPSEQSRVYIEHGAFVLASRYDPWPLVLVEACASGLPIVHTEACGSAVELVRPLYNGIGVATGDAGALCAGLAWMHQHHGQLPEMGHRGQELARPYSAEFWADRWEQMFRELVGAST